jgi:hypothetical protein
MITRTWLQLDIDGSDMFRDGLSKIHGFNDATVHPRNGYN